MPFNGVGTYAPPAADFPVITATTVSSTHFNNTINDMSTGISNCLTKDGQTSWAANQPTAGFKLTNMGAGSARLDSTRIAEVQDGTFLYGGTAAGTADALTLILAPAITAYVLGQVFYFKASASPNTTAATMQINGIASPKAIQKNGAALIAGDIAASKYYAIFYDGAAFQLFSLQQLSVPTGTETFTNKTLTNYANTTQTLTDAATINWDHSLGQVAKVTLTASGHTLASPTNIKAGGSGFFDVVQDATGTRTMLWGAAYKFVGGVTPVLSTAISARDRFYWSSFDGATVDVTQAKGMA